ncbi:MAG: hypothetical protein IKY50_02160 [Alistipes sp.]|nr:hypothetical protein [Alistipes sp.]
MKRFFFYLLAIMTMVACSKENNEPQPQPEPQPDPTPVASFNISVQEDKLAAFSVTFDIVPDDKEAKYYYDIISKARISEINIAALKNEIEEGSAKMAELTGTPYEEVLDQMLSKGDQLNILSNAGYRPETDFYIYAFYWDAEENAKLTLCEFRTPAIEESKESITLETASVETHALTINVEPTAGVTEYWYYFAERSKAEAMFKELEDNNAFMSYHAMNVGSRMEGTQTMEHKGLKPNTEYMAVAMGIDSDLNRFQVSEVFTTLEEQTQQRVESVLFEKLLGEWTGVQTVTDLYAEPAENTFTVNILSQVDDVEYDYRAMNQLVATVDGWCSIDYYSTTELLEMEIEDAEEKWGPKWVFNIAEGDVVTMDGMARNSVVGWLFFGDCFMLNTTADNQGVSTNADFDVEVSADYNTITIKSPASMPNAYPGLGYYFDGFGWMGYYYGMSNIVLTRK